MVLATRGSRAVASGLRLALLSSLVACSSSPAAHDAGIDGGADSGNPNALSCVGRSGTRLRQTLQVHDDGSLQFLRLHDSQFDEDCTYATAGDGAVRCLPQVDNNPFAAGQVRYLDAGCTQGLAELGAAGITPAPAYLATSAASADGCSQVTSYYTLGAIQAVTAGQTIYALQGGSCVATTAGAVDHYAIAGDLPLTSFVEGTVAPTASGRLSIQQIQGDDGSRFCGVMGPFHDADLDSDCDLQYGEDGAIRCLPHAAGAQQVFTDSGCTAPAQVVLQDKVCGGQVGFSYESAQATCSYRVRVHQLGDPISTALYQQVGMCTAIDTSAQFSANQVGPVVSVYSFADFTRAYVTAGSRLERGDLVSGGLRVFRFQWRDPMVGTPCTFMPADDGSVRCLPDNMVEAPVAQLTTVYSDAACTVPVTVGQLPMPCEQGDPTFAVDPAGPNRVYQVTGVQPGPLYLDPAACAPAPADAVYYAIGAEVPPDMFVSASEMTE